MTRSSAPPRSRIRADGTTEIFCYGEIGDGWDGGVTARQFVADLRAAGSGPVDVRIDSPGGDAFQGLAVYEALRGHAGRTRVFVDGLAASAASVIAMGGDEVIVAGAGMIMIHDASSMSWGNQDDHLAAAAVLGQVSDAIAGVYAARAGGTAAAWRKVMKTERWYSASEAVAAGLADRVADNAQASDPRASLTGNGRAIAACIREGIRAHAGAVGGVVYARAGGPARRPAGRRPVPSVMPALRALKAAQR